MDDDIHCDDDKYIKYHGINQIKNGRKKTGLLTTCSSAHTVRNAANRQSLLTQGIEVTCIVMFFVSQDIK